MNWESGAIRLGGFSTISKTMEWTPPSGGIRKCLCGAMNRPRKKGGTHPSSGFLVFMGCFSTVVPVRHALQSVGVAVASALQRMTFNLASQTCAEPLVEQHKNDAADAPKRCARLRAG